MIKDITEVFNDLELFDEAANKEFEKFYYNENLTFEILRKKMQITEELRKEEEEMQRIQEKFENKKETAEDKEKIGKDKKEKTFEEKEEVKATNKKEEEGSSSGEGENVSNIEENRGEVDLEEIINTHIYSNVEDMGSFLHCLRRVVIFNAFKDIYPFSKYPWAKTSVNLLLTNSYLNK